ncbi:AraC-like DNA-binding protein [Bacillus niacini]|uniref:AraC-like DNA-binding protein n=1 Tax=Neobacillus niacini TaxID=86668 RepID=A0A852T455_9BACI|nr:helix-turn-helix domain-containing protein [Neobacillus niacini]NYE03462.1 AraC-like DNA-binding protein [Neobacillus niacini]
MRSLPKVQSKLLTKYVLSYVLMFFIPLITTSMIIYENSASSLQAGIEQSNIDKLNQVKAITDERMEELEKLALRISYDPRLTPFMVNDGFYSKEAVEELNKYKANSSIIKELFLYYHGDRNLYSSQGSYSLETFEKKYDFAKGNSGKIRTLLDSDVPVISPAELVKVNENEMDKLLVYLYPLKRSPATPYGSVTYFIEESAMTDLIKDTLSDFQGNAYIFDHQKNVLTSTINSAALSKADMQKLNNIKDGVSNLKINGEEFSVVSVKSSISGWTFVTVMPTHQFFKKVISLQRLLWMILASVIISGIGFSILLARKQYRPIHNLLDFIKSNQISHIDDMNELDTIKFTIDRVFKDHASLSEKIDSQAPYVRHQFLMQILNGKLTDETEINRLLESNSIPMYKDGYFVTAVSLRNLNMQEQEEMIHLLSKKSFLNAICYGVEVGYKEAIAVIVSMDKPCEPSKVVEDLHAYIKEHLGPEPVFSVGNVYTDKSRINHSFIEALAALEYRFMHGHKRITHFEEITNSTEKTIGYPKEEQIKLVQSLKQGDGIVALEAMNHMFASMIEKDISVQMVKCISFDIINTVLKAAIEAGLGNGNHPIGPIVDFNSIEELEKRLEPVVMAICKDIERKNECSRSRLGNEIIDYIQKNFSNYDLSLESTAQLFKLSTSYLSRFFKEQTGVTFTQYVWILRFEQVKRKLANTDETIRDIVLEAGYMDVANFTRKFKKAEGVTPGQYRSLYGGKKQSNTDEQLRG